MKKFFMVLASVVWVAGGIAAIAVGVSLKSFLLALLYFAIAFIAGSLYYAIYMLLNNQDEIKDSLRSLSGKLNGVNKSASDGWRCVCGRYNHSSVYTCSCGRDKGATK